MFLGSCGIKKAREIGLCVQITLAPLFRMKENDRGCRWRVPLSDRRGTHRGKFTLWYGYSYVYKHELCIHITSIYTYFMCIHKAKARHACKRMALTCPYVNAFFVGTPLIPLCLQGINSYYLEKQSRHLNVLSSVCVFQIIKTAPTPNAPRADS